MNPYMAEKPKKKTFLPPIKSLAVLHTLNDDPLSENLNNLRMQKQQIYLKNLYIGKDKSFEDR